ncbi:MAG: fasciclin domain-containing protein [Saprospiraceae bacterium]|nr:fasciclin domain-containing protein [Saprospiraceae bacterium]
MDAQNGVIHAIDRVLQFPSQTIAQLATANRDLSTLLAALVKTNLAATFTTEGDFTVFAPTNRAFAKLPAPFNNANNINAITNQAQIRALANILTYHVVAARNFTPDFGFRTQLTTLAAAPSNKVETIFRFTTSTVKGNNNRNPTITHPEDVLATNGVVHIIGDVLQP